MESDSSAFSQPSENQCYVVPPPSDDLPYADLQTRQPWATDPPGQDVSLPACPWETRRVETTADMTPAATTCFSSLSDPARIKDICLSKIAAWSGCTADDVEVNQIMAGLTNQLFKVIIKREDLQPKQVLFRIFGASVGDLYDPSFEKQTFKSLSNLKIAPRVIAKFDGGRVEQWIYGDPLPVQKTQLPSVLSAVASILARFHLILKEHGEAFLPNVPRPTVSKMWSTISEYGETSLKILNSLPASDPKHAALVKLDIPFRIKQAKWLRGEIDRLAANASTGEALAYQVVFCHNDVQENNILKVDNHYLRIIDFEYSNFNHAGCDVANYFNENMLDYCVEKHPFFRFTPSDYPDLEKRRFFAASYLSARLDEEIMPSHCLVDSFLEAVEVLGCLTATTWGFWGVIRCPQAPTADEFDCIAFSVVEFEILDERIRALHARGVFSPPPAV